MGEQIEQEQLENMLSSPLYSIMVVNGYNLPWEQIDSTVKYGRIW